MFDDSLDFLSDKQVLRNDSRQFLLQLAVHYEFIEEGKQAKCCKVAICVKI